MDLEVLAYAAPGAFVLLIIWYWSRPRPRCRRASMPQAQERRREELLQQLTFFFSSLRHVYNKYPPHRLPPALRAECQFIRGWRDFQTCGSRSLLKGPQPQLLHPRTPVGMAHALPDSCVPPAL